jgi:chromosome segregation ATPase
VANAELARGKAQSAVSQLEKRLASIEQARKDTETKLSDSLERQKELIDEAAAAQQAKREQEQRLAAVVAREKEQQAQLAALKKAVDDKAREAEALAARHQQQLERAKQHYNSMESRLAALLEENKSARQKL